LLVFPQQGRPIFRHLLVIKEKAGRIIHTKLVRTANTSRPQGSMLVSDVSRQLMSALVVHLSKQNRRVSVKIIILTLNPKKTFLNWNI
jgi:hypothetical protein